jgi:phosphoribosylamine--glycine ligase
VVGSGGREHALAWSLSRSPAQPTVLVAPGNGGIAADFECLAVAVSDASGLIELCREREVDLVVVGPEQPLVEGLADRMRAAGIACFGPGAEAARLEGSKVFAKACMVAAGVPTARAESFSELDAALAFVRAGPERRWVVKADGLAAGKGVLMCPDRAATEAALVQAMGERRFGEAGAQVLVEEWLHGQEMSLFVLCDGRDFRSFPALRDHKRVGVGDTGPNTGGMGAFQPVPGWGPVAQRRCEEEIVEPILEHMRATGAAFRGLLFVGIMWTSEGPKVLEFNVRFGDPETQALMAALDADLYGLLAAAARGDLGELPMDLLPGASCCVVLANDGYPGGGPRGQVIEGLERVAGLKGVVVFHAGSSRRDGRWIATGGRVLGVTAVGGDLAEARSRAFEAASMISWEGMHYRNDIGAGGGSAAPLGAQE